MNFQSINQFNQGIAKIIGIVLVVFLVVLTIFVVVLIGNKIEERRYIGQEIEAKHTISVTGAGEIYSKPDLALINFSVATEAKTVTEAMSENTKKMNAVIEFIKKQGVEEKNLKTTSFNIYPRYEYIKSEVPPYTPAGKRILVGYEIRQSLQVKIRDLAKIGQIIEGATEAGANQVDNLQFTIDNQDELKKQAREEAIKEAKEKAKELAKQLGVRLVKITGFSESGYAPRFYSFGAKALEAAPESSPQIEAGENKISVTVTITYEID